MYKKINLAAGEMAQSVKSLHCKHEGLNLIPSTHIKMPGVCGDTHLFS